MPRRLKIASHLVAVPEGVVESSAGNISVMQKRTSGLQDYGTSAEVGTELDRRTEQRRPGWFNCYDSFQCAHCRQT